MKKLLVLALLVTSAACSQGGGGSSGGESCGSKNLLSTWHSNPGNIPFDFSNVQLGSLTNATLMYADGTCQYDMFMSGSQCSGSIVLNNPVLLNGTTNCALMVGTFNYTKSAASGLMVCAANDPADCTQFQ